MAKLDEWAIRSRPHVPRLAWRGLLSSLARHWDLLVLLFFVLASIDPLCFSPRTLSVAHNVSLADFGSLTKGLVVTLPLPLPMVHSTSCFPACRCGVRASPWARSTRLGSGCRPRGAPLENSDALGLGLDDAWRDSARGCRVGTDRHAPVNSPPLRIARARMRHPVYRQMFGEPLGAGKGGTHGISASARIIRGVTARLDPL
jgi:hypothetical protein